MLLALFGLLSAAPAAPEILPSFSLAHSAFEASDILLVSEGERIDGELVVLESWKGGYEAGEQLRLPALAEFAPEEERQAHAPLWQPEKADSMPIVSGDRMLVFLAQPEGDALQPAPSHLEGRGTQPASIYGGQRVATIWLEGGAGYAVQQLINPGPSRMTPLGQNEESLRQSILELAEARSNVERLAQIEDVPQRTQSLRALVIETEHRAARALAYRRLGECGPEALPVLEELVLNEALAGQGSMHVEALRPLGTELSGPLLARLLEGELAFWTELAPHLELGWWSDFSELGGTTRNLRQARYSRALGALRLLVDEPHPAAIDVAQRLALLWRGDAALASIDQMAKTAERYVVRARGQ